MLQPIDHSKFYSTSTCSFQSNPLISPDGGWYSLAISLFEPLMCHTTGPRWDCNLDDPVHWWFPEF
jgi:hypothetical protein